MFSNGFSCAQRIHICTVHTRVTSERCQYGRVLEKKNNNKTMSEIFYNDIFQKMLIDRRLLLIGVRNCIRTALGRIYFCSRVTHTNKN